MLTSFGGELNPSTITSSIPSQYKNAYIILDNGHGINTPGKRSPDGRLREYAWAREITKKIKQKLDSLGIESYILVPELIDISLQERVNRANKIYKEQKNKNVILLSIHCNASGNGRLVNIVAK